MIAGVLFPLILASTILASPPPRQTQAMRQYTIYNKCPVAIDLYIGGAVQETIPTNGNVVKTLSTDVSYIYTDANGGSQNAATGTIRVAFYQNFYDIIADPDHVNTGLQVAPNNAPYNGFCQTIECNAPGCPQAFSEYPTTYPSPTSDPPNPPFYRCPVGDTLDYAITFCYTGELPDKGQPIHFDDMQEECLDVQAAVVANGTPVQLYECNGTQAQRWVINKGSTKVRLAGTNFCLDAGTSPANGTQLKIWECYDNLPSQQWYYTDDNRIQLENQGFCTDLTDGVVENANIVQIWTCVDNNTNQIWTL